MHPETERLISLLKAEALECKKETSRKNDSFANGYLLGEKNAYPRIAGILRNIDFTE